MDTYTYITATKCHRNAIKNVMEKQYSPKHIHTSKKKTEKKRKKKTTHIHTQKKKRLFTKQKAMVN